MMRNYDLFGPDGQRAVIFAAAAQQGKRIEIGLQVWNQETLCWEKKFCTRTLPEDTVGIAFEIQRVCDKATTRGFHFTNMRKEVVAL